MWFDKPEINILCEDDELPCEYHRIKSELRQAKPFTDSFVVLSKLWAPRFYTLFSIGSYSSVVREKSCILQAPNSLLSRLPNRRWSFFSRVCIRKVRLHWITLIRSAPDLYTPSSSGYSRSLFVTICVHCLAPLTFVARLARLCIVQQRLSIHPPINSPTQVSPCVLYFFPLRQSRSC